MALEADINYQNIWNWFLIYINIVLIKLLTWPYMAALEATSNYKKYSLEYT